jgi:hypothetical protein
MQISGLLEVYKKRLRAPQKTVIAAFCEAVLQVASITIEPRLVRYIPTTRTINISASGVLKQEIKMREQAILMQVVKDIGEKNSPQHIM